ncbi:MAG: DUF6809 family protein [Candidatus Limivicinus sp.]
MNILEEFWYGNIEPAEYDTSSGKEYKELLQLISRNEDKLLATMTEEQKELFTKYADCVREYQVKLARQNKSNKSKVLNTLLRNMLLK